MIRTREAASPVKENDIASFERAHGIVLPPAYRQFLLKRNGGRPERDRCIIPNFPPDPIARIHFFFGLGYDIDGYDLAWNRKLYSAPEFLVIATTEGADTFCIGVAGEYCGQVFFWDGGGDETNEHRLHRVANSFEEFINGLFRDELSPKMDEKPS